MIKKIKNRHIFVIVTLLILIFFIVNLNNKKTYEIESDIVPTETQLILGTPRVVPDVPKDAIPPLDFPKYVQAHEVDFLMGNDLVLGIEINGDVRAYPLKIMNWHEIVNDNIGGRNVVVTYCPLCKSGVLFSRELEGKTLSFGNTGSLWESVLLMYDRETESFWAQVGGRAVEGTLKGKRLEMLPSITTRWKDWKNLYPDTLVLSPDTGYDRNYKINAYDRYYLDKEKLPPFPLSLIDNRLLPKDLVIGVKLGDEKIAYPVDKIGWKIVHDSLNGENIVLFTRPKLSGVYFSDLEGTKMEFEIINNSIFDKNTDSRWNFLGQSIEGPLKGKRLRSAPIAYTFWYGWVAEYPDTMLYESN